MAYASEYLATSLFRLLAHRSCCLYTHGNKVVANSAIYKFVESAWMNTVTLGYSDQDYVHKLTAITDVIAIVRWQLCQFDNQGT